MATVREGDAFPDFRRPDATGCEVSRSQLAGRPFVLYAYPKDDTPGCTSEAKDFSALVQAFDEIGVAVLGLSPDPVDRHARFTRKHDLQVRLLGDEDRVLIGALGLWVRKSMYGKSFEGVERTTYLVDGSGIVRRVWTKVRVAGHAQEVLEAARGLVAKPG